MRNNSAKKIALSGMLAALALVIMCMGGMIPVATYVCPMLCMVLGCFVLRVCGRRHAWTWYAAVSILALLMGPDKEAATVYVFLGYYPLIKVGLERFRFAVVLKFLYFNAAVFVLYGLLIFVMGLNDLYTEFSSAGIWWIVLLLILGNLTFFLLDRVLTRFLPKR